LIVLRSYLITHCSYAECSNILFLATLTLLNSKKNFVQLNKLGIIFPFGMGMPFHIGRSGLCDFKVIRALNSYEAILQNKASK